MPKNYKQLQTKGENYKILQKLQNGFLDKSAFFWAFWVFLIVLCLRIYYTLKTAATRNYKNYKNLK
jgi:hypothetical protein